MIHTLAFLFSTLVIAAPQATSCEALESLSLPHARIVRASRVAAATERSGTALPDHCRVEAVLAPSADSHIEMQIWLPVEGWNGKFLAVGNGGWAGSISTRGLAEGLAEGYATASNDTGHEGGSAQFALGHPEKVVDFGYRAMHEMALGSKAVIRAFYGEGPQLSYFNGCSTGGRQALMEAQRYPEDFDGIVAGAPVYNHIELHASQMAKTMRLLEDGAFVPAEKIALLNEKVLATCDAGDGVEDGFLNNPAMCSFEPASLRCAGSGTDLCLTPSQLEAVRTAYAPTETADGELVYPGHALGFEAGWRMPQPGSAPSGTASDTFRYLAHQDPDWDWQTFDLERDLTLAREHAGFIDAADPDVAEFKARGGKLLLYHGWNDPGPSPYNTLNYYSEVLETMGAGQDDWLRVFMMPGVAHCGGGAGPDQADFLGALAGWRETGEAPDRIIASNRSGDLTRPLCPYPQIATWTGTGSTGDAENFVCENP